MLGEAVRSRSVYWPGGKGTREPQEQGEAYTTEQRELIDNTRTSCYLGGELHSTRRRRLLVLIEGLGGGSGF